MKTINISLPEKLHEKATELVKNGYYASFSDLTRTAVHRIIAEEYYDMLFKETKNDLKNGKAVVLKNQRDIDEFFDKLEK